MALIPCALLAFTPKTITYTDITSTKRHWQYFKGVWGNTVTKMDHQKGKACLTS